MLGTRCFAQPMLLWLKKKAGERSPACLVTISSLSLLHLLAPVLILQVVLFHELVEHLLLRTRRASSSTPAVHLHPSDPQGGGIFKRPVVSPFRHHTLNSSHWAIKRMSTFFDRTLDWRYNRRYSLAWMLNGMKTSGKTTSKNTALTLCGPRRFLKIPSLNKLTTEKIMEKNGLSRLVIGTNSF